MDERRERERNWEPEDEGERHTDMPALEMTADRCVGRSVDRRSCTRTGPKKKVKKATSALAISRRKDESSDFFGKSKHYGFIEFENPKVAKVVADEIHGYLLFEHQLQIYPIPPERVHPKFKESVKGNNGMLGSGKDAE